MQRHANQRQGLARPSVETGAQRVLQRFEKTTAQRFIKARVRIGAP
jgi:hypothetical protein